MAAKPLWQVYTSYCARDKRCGEQAVHEVAT